MELFKINELYFGSFPSEYIVTATGEYGCCSFTDSVISGGGSTLTTKIQRNSIQDFALVCHEITQSLTLINFH